MSEELEVQESVVEEQVEHDFVKEASLDGWVPKEQYRGPEENWVDAEEFVTRGKERNAILRKNNERLQQKIEEIEKRLAETDLSAKEFRKFQKDLLERKEQEYKLQIEDLRQQKKDAISIGDGDAVLAIEDKMEELKAAKPEQQQQEPEKKADPVFEQWMADNNWYTKDKKMTAFADAVGEEVRQNEPHLKGNDFLNRVVELVRQEMPHKFTKEERMSPVEGGTTDRQPSKVGGKKDYSKLPPEAKAACDDFVKRGWMTKEEYVNSYEWDV